MFAEKESIATSAAAPRWAAYYLDGMLFLKRYGYDPTATYPDFGCSFDITLLLRGCVRLVVFLVACQVFEEPPGGLDLAWR